MESPIWLRLKTELERTVGWRENWIRRSEAGNPTLFSKRELSISRPRKPVACKQGACTAELLRKVTFKSTSCELPYKSTTGTGSLELSKSEAWIVTVASSRMVR